ncbi:MAG: Diaminopimelate decarboxylase [Candidatus Alkanophagales archaeon MCA70_species_2]|nr:Diaminopimelate decarboxylase [Candidatus Alkanophaga liquidiphilum]
MGKHLIFGGVDVIGLAERFGTPLYVTDEQRLRENFRRFRDAFSSVASEIYYAVKANWNLAVLRILAQEGAGADVFSGGELYLARLAGIPASKILFNGNSKSDEELELAALSGVKVSVDSFDELYALSEVARSLGKTVEIAMRVNPDISPETHPKIATGLKESKFGIPYEEVLDAYKEAKKLEATGSVRVKGIHCHIGSQILDVSIFRETTEKMIALVEALSERGIELEFVDLGGGLGIPYKKDEPAPTPEDLAAQILPAFKSAKLRRLPKLILEPGRYIVGNTTILVARVNAVKKAARRFVAIDAGFNLLIRPALYDAYHEVVVANKMDEPPAETYTVVGPICESGDIIAKDRTLPEVKRGDIIAIFNAGAYGFAMSSQYNGRPRCAEILVNAGKAEVIRRKESFDELLRNQVLPARLL